MKRCPQCNRTYSDESIAFCLADGALLSAPYDSEATQRIPSPLSNPPVTEILPVQSSTAIERISGRRFVYVVVGVMVGLVIVLAGVFIVPLVSQDRKQDKTLKQGDAPNENAVNNTSSLEASRTANARTDAPTPTLSPSDSINTNRLSTPLELAGTWQGQWSSPFGTIFTANVYLEATGSGNGVQGNISWTMKSTPQASKQSKIGLTAREFVRGSYDSQTRLLTMEGYREDDPNNIITLDKYRLVLGADDRSLGGPTWNHGGWRGRLSLSR